MAHIIHLIHLQGSYLVEKLNFCCFPLDNLPSPPTLVDQSINRLNFQEAKINFQHFTIKALKLFFSFSKSFDRNFFNPLFWYLKVGLGKFEKNRFSMDESFLSLLLERKNFIVAWIDIIECSWWVRLKWRFQLKGWTTSFLGKFEGEEEEEESC